MDCLTHARFLFVCSYEVEKQCACNRLKLSMRVAEGETKNDFCCNTYLMRSVWFLIKSSAFYESFFMNAVEIQYNGRQMPTSSAHVSDLGTMMRVWSGGHSPVPITFGASPKLTSPEKCFFHEGTKRETVPRRACVHWEYSF